MGEPSRSNRLAPRRDPSRNGRLTPRAICNSGPDCKVSCCSTGDYFRVVFFEQGGQLATPRGVIKAENVVTPRDGWCK
jgi:hypothetical protein